MIHGNVTKTVPANHDQDPDIHQKSLREAKTNSREVIGNSREATKTINFPETTHGNNFREATKGRMEEEEEQRSDIEMLVMNVVEVGEEHVTEKNNERTETKEIKQTKDVIVAGSLGTVYGNVTKRNSKINFRERRK